jgi:hypothetical protein
VEDAKRVAYSSYTFVLVLGSEGEMTDIDHHFLEDADLVSLLSPPIGQKKPPLQYIRLHVRFQKDTPVSIVRHTLVKLRAAAPQDMVTIVLVDENYTRILAP